MDAMHALTSIYGVVVLLILVAAGFLCMFRPDSGRKLIGRAALSILLFTVGIMLLQAACSAFRQYWR